MKRLYPVGEVLLFDPAGRLANVKLVAALRIDDLILVKGERTNFRQAVRIMYKDRNPIQKAKMGEIIWLGVIKRVYQGDKVFRIILDTPPPPPPPDDPPEPVPPPEKPYPVKPVLPEPKDPRPDNPPDDDEPDLPDPNDIPWGEKEDEPGGGTNG